MKPKWFSFCAQTYMATTSTWWKEAVVYQIYPRSFKDSNGDGIGDLAGILSKLDYVQSLGIDVIWLNPIYGSPNDDNGYDISDYQSIMKEFGTMAEFDALLEGLHKRGIKLIMDLVVNHSSDEHPWFIDSRKSRDSRYRHFYHWWPAEKGEPPYRWSVFDVNGNAWAYDKTTDAYYLHYFSVKQPDLNWENPELRRHVYDMMHFWFKKGIDGFRMDVITAISKDPDFPVITPETLHVLYNNSWPAYYAAGPNLHGYLQEMNREVLSKYPIMTVAEGWGITPDNALDFVDEERHELNMLYHFDGMEIRHLPGNDHDPKYDLRAFKQVYTRWDRLFAERGWGTVYLGNHDQSRIVSRWGNDSPSYRVLSSKMLITFLLTMRGTPYFYAGDELGMTSIKFDCIEDYQDINTINNYKRIMAEGGDTETFLKQEMIYSRDNGRTPFQWDNTLNAGFTAGKPWLKVNSNFSEINASAAERDPGSTLHYFRDLIGLRKKNKTLVYGRYCLVDENNPASYCYLREDENCRLLVALNFSSIEHTAVTNVETINAKILLGNYVRANLSSENGRLLLRPYEALVIELAK
jgi:oligo-1,6-glucosidase